MTDIPTYEGKDSPEFQKLLEITPKIHPMKLEGVIKVDRKRK